MVKIPIVLFLFWLSPGINCLQAQDHGFLRVDEHGRYFVFDDSTPYVPIGFNKFMLYKETDSAIDSLLRLWSGHGVNFLRVWVGLNSEPEIQVGKFDPERMAKLDYIIAKCDEYDIGLILCFWDENTLRSGWSNGWDSGKNKYNLAFDSLGTTTDAEDLKGVDHLPSWNALKNRYDIFVNRWKHHQAIIMWDLVNDSKKTDEWKSEMYDFVRSLDETGRIITFQYNTGRNPQGEMDCGSVRVYDYNPEGNDPEEMTKSLFQRVLEALPYGDPVYCGEGRMHYGQGSPYELERFFLHSLWGPIAVGAAGNLHSWLSPSKEDRWPDLSLQELKWLKGFSEFGNSINWSEFNSKNVNHLVAPGDENVLAYACADEDETLLYLMHDDPDHEFNPVKTRLKISTGFKKLPVKIQWIDIRTGEVIKTQKIKSLPVDVDVPAFRDGIFAYLKK